MTGIVSTLGILAARDPSGLPVALIMLLIMLVMAVIIVMLFISRYKRCPSNKVLVIYGKTGSGAARCVHGGAAFVWPMIQAYDYLDLEPFVVPIDLANALSFENIRVTVPTTVTAAVSNEMGIMENAAVRLLGLARGQIQDQAQDIILGQMRAVIATMKIEEINQDRQAFLAKVNEAVSGELEKIGLALINVNIRDIDDESGYIKALGRKAAAEAINQANIDVAEQEKSGQTGVAQRQRDTRVAVAAANSEADIGEASADRDRRQKVAQLIAEAEIGEAAADRDRRKQKAQLDAEAKIGESSADRDRRQSVAQLEAEAVSTETEADAAKATYRANQRVAEEEARNRSESATQEADGAIRVTQEKAQEKAEQARAEREKARLNAEVVVPANAAREKMVIDADARKQEAIRLAEGEAEAVLAKMTAEGKGVQAILAGKADGYSMLVEGCTSAQQAAALLLIERLTEVAGIQAQAIQDLPIEKIMVWDGGGKGDGLAGLGGRIMGALPPMQDLAKQVGIELPEFLGRVAEEAAKSKKENPEKPASDSTPASDEKELPRWDPDSDK